MALIPVLVSAYAPHKTVSLALEEDATVFDVKTALQHVCPLRAQVLSTQSGHSLDNDTLLSSLRTDSHAVCLRLCAQLCGGKGGFGSQLRAAGGRMASKGGRNARNTDSCRDLNGRRLSSVKEAQALQQQMESAPEREKAAKEQQRAKLEGLQKEVARMDAYAAEGEAGASTSKLGKRKAGGDHDAFVERNRETVDNVKSAVAAGVLRPARGVEADSEFQPC
jgi:hypothetical protein